ncbi:STAS domain-containing protein [Luedemannella flava]
MTGQLICQVETGGDVIAVHPSGPLDLAATARLRSVLLKALAEAPLAIILDMRQLVIVDDVCLTMLPAVAKRAAGEPGTALLLYGVGVEAVRGMSALGIDRYLTLCDSWEDAVARAHEDPDSSRVAQHFRGASARWRTRGPWQPRCVRWRVPVAVTARVQVIVTELVSNVVRHVGTPLELVLRRSPRYVHIAVLDGDERRPHLRGPDEPYSAGGRGLLLVDAFAAAWGSHPTATGKSTWATVRYRPLSA